MCTHKQHETLVGNGSGVDAMAFFDGSFAVAGQGSLTVVANAPLRVRVDFTVTDGTGAVHRIIGEMTIAYQRDRAGCT